MMPTGILTKKIQRQLSVSVMYPAERRPEHGRDDRGDRGDAEGRAALRRRERVEDDRLLVRLHAAAEKPLQQTEDDELAAGCRRCRTETSRP